MWKNRPEQVTTFPESSLRDFEDSLVGHLHAFIPQLAEALGEERLRKVIRYGLEHSRPYGFASGGSIRFFIEMIILFGAEFDSDPQYPWAKQILTDPSIADPMVRGDRLHARAIEYLDKVSGPDRQY